MTSTSYPFRHLRWIHLGFILASSLIGCNSEPQETGKNSINVKVVRPWSSDDIKQAFYRITNLPDSSIKVRTCPCDSTLLNIKLPTNWIIEGHSGTMTVKSDTDGTGDGGVIELPEGAITGINYPISTYDDSQNKPDMKATEGMIFNNLSLGNKNPGQTIKVAIFDSGLNDLSDQSVLLTKTYQCKETGKYDEGNPSKNGWNFVGTSNGLSTNTADMTPIHHGSRVAYLMAKQFNGSPATPLIVPMRVLDAANKGDLFGLMCAMETARINGIKVFNMSLGYYGQADTLLKSYIERATKYQIWIVAAAGNRPPDASDTVNRDMASMSPKFYPAYFSKNFRSVLSVTTVLDATDVKASARQNFGKETVYGILADKVENGEGLIRLVGGDQSSNRQDLLIFGTSYATPILTGRLARYLVENPNGNPNSQSQLRDLHDHMEQGARGDQVIGNRFFRSAPAVP